MKRGFSTPYEFIKQFCRCCKYYIKLDNEGCYICGYDTNTYITDKLDDNCDAICSCNNGKFEYENKTGRRY